MEYITLKGYFWCKTKPYVVDWGTLPALALQHEYMDGDLTIMRIRLGQQEKMIEKLRIDLERITNEIVIFLFIIRKRDKKM